MACGFYQFEEADLVNVTTRRTTSGGPSTIVRQLIMSRASLASALCLFLLSGCATRPLSTSRAELQTCALRDQLLALNRAVTPSEAARLAETAVSQSAALAREYRAVRPAFIHNYLVNCGWRNRGLCYQWANDLFKRLHQLDLQTLELHLAVARMDTKHEHNSIIVTAKGQPLLSGVVFDAWRHSGRLWFGRASTDKYPWQPLPPDRVAPDLRGLIRR